MKSERNKTLTIESLSDNKNELLKNVVFDINDLTVDKITNKLVMADLKKPGSVKKLVNGAKAAGVVGASAAAVGAAVAIAKKKIKK